MSLIEKANKNKIIEKKIILRKKINSLSQDSLIPNSAIPQNNYLCSKIPQYTYNINPIKIIKNDNIRSAALYISKGNILKSDNKPYFNKRNKIINKVNFHLEKNITLLTPLKDNYELNSDTKNLSTGISSNSDSKTKHTIAEYTNKTDTNSNYIELNPITNLYKNKKEIYSCYLNKRDNAIKKVNNITKFNEKTYLMEPNKINYNKSETQYNDFANDKSCFDLNNCDCENEKTMKNKINLEKIFINLNETNSNNNNETDTVDEKIKFKNPKHIFVHRRRLSSFLINNQNNKFKDDDKENENSETKSKYVHKRANKSFSCINLKQKIINERYNISKSKRKSKIIDLNTNEFVSIEKNIHKGGKISLFNNISNFKFPSNNDFNNCQSEFKDININNLKSIIKIQKWFKNHIRIKKVILIQNAFRKHSLFITNNNNFNKNLIIKKYKNNKCEFITKKYKCKNLKFLEKIVLIQKSYEEHSLKNKMKFNKVLNLTRCYISKIKKSKKIINNIILLQRKFRKFLRNRYIYNNNCLNHFNNQKKKKSKPHSHQRNRDLSYIDSYNNSKAHNIANEFESNRKKLITINKNDSIKTLYLNYQKNLQINNFQYNPENEGNINKEEKKINDISPKSSFNEELDSNEKFHYLPNNGFLIRHKYNQNNLMNFDRYNEESTNQDVFNCNNGKDRYLISSFFSLNDDKETPKSIKINNLKEIFFKNFHKKIIFALKITKIRLYLINFINMLAQRLLKNINQYVFFIFLKKYNSKNENIKENIFFNTIKRLKSLTKAYIPKEIRILIDNNIPIFLNKKQSTYFISYIKPSYEKNLVNTQLFQNKEWLFLNFIYYFLKEEKNKVLNKVLINNYLTRNKIHNRNIFTIIRYIDSLAVNLANIYDNKTKNSKLIKLGEQKGILNNYLEKAICFKPYKNKNDYKNNSNDEIVNIGDKSKSNINVEDNLNNIDDESINNNHKNYKIRSIITFKKNDFWNEDDILISNNKIINKEKSNILKRYVNKK